MRGKEPKEREKYVIRLGGGTLVEVDREIYLEWYRSERRERYQKERDRKYGVCSLDGLVEKGCFSGKDGYMGDVTLETVFWNISRDKLWKAIGKLPEQDARLVRLLYFEEIPVKEVAVIFGCCRKTIEKRKERILKELRYKIGNIEIMRL